MGVALKRGGKKKSLRSLGCLAACGAHCHARGDRGCRTSSPGGLWVAPAQHRCASRLVPQIGLFDLEVNCLTKILFGALVVVSLVMVALQHFAGRWYLQIIRFLLLFSNIIPIR